MRRIVLASVLLLAPLAACTEAEAPKAAAPAPLPAAAKPTAAAPLARTADGKILVKATRDGFEPARIEVKGGQPVKLVFQRDEEKTCMTGVVFPSLAIDKDLPLGTPVEVEVTPPAGGELAFECPMGMGKSKIVGLP